jgi:hypothetical protein
MTQISGFRNALAFAAALLLPAAAQAQLFRAYLAPTGLDTNPCTLAAPCRLLPAALAAVASGGEIWMLDSANYNSGTVNITKSVTILAVPTALGSVVASGGSAISIATAGVKVALRNLVIVPVPGAGGIHGVFMSAGTSLTVENCVIANLPQVGILVDALAILRVADTTIRDNGSYGIALLNGARGTVTRSAVSGNASHGIYVTGTTSATLTTADIADTTVDGNAIGIYAWSQNASATVEVSVHDSRAVGNAVYGAAAQSAFGAAAKLSASNNMISNNGNGIAASSTGSKVWLSGNTVTDNTGYGLANLGGVFDTLGNNAVLNNAGGDTNGGTITMFPAN